jgi:hypothetical protein
VPFTSHGKLQEFGEEFGAEKPIPYLNWHILTFLQ